MVDFWKEITQKAIVILGPTSSGKTSLAIKIAKEINGAIISADSRQVYKSMDIGTGKVPVKQSYKIQKEKDKWQVDGVDLYMYDLVFPNEDFSVSTYVALAKKFIFDVISKGQIPVIVGGTGFYIDILTNEQRVFPVEPDEKLRQQLRKLSLAQLQQMLRNLDKEKFEQIDINNPVRIIRAIEVIKSGKSDESIGLIDFEYLKLGLSTDREDLFSRADSWVKEIIKYGLIDEVKDLISRGYINTQPMQGMIYKTVLSYLNGEIILKEDLETKIKFELHNYIRRQQTYFKKVKEVIWYDIKDNTFDQTVLKQVKSFHDGENSK